MKTSWAVAVLCVAMVLVLAMGASPQLTTAEIVGAVLVATLVVSLIMLAISWIARSRKK